MFFFNTVPTSALSTPIETNLRQKALRYGAAGEPEASATGGFMLKVRGTTIS